MWGKVAGVSDGRAPHLGYVSASKAASALQQWHTTATVLLQVSQVQYFS